MSYKIFVSYSLQESELAEFIKNSLSKLFKNKVSFHFNNIRGGDKWKESIQKGLTDSDAIMTILTPKYLEKPWAYIEWAAFWLRDKVTYIIVTDDVEIKDIVDPMRDSQTTNIFNESHVIKLLEAIAEKSVTDSISYDTVSEIVNKSRAIYEKLLFDDQRKKYSIYKGATELLPNDDFKKAEILWYFYEKESDKNAFAEIFKTINDNSIKGNILMRLLEKNDFHLIEELYEFVESKNNLLPLLRGLVENGFEDLTLTSKILTYTAASQPALRSFCEYLIKNRRADSNALLNAIPLFANRAELRRIGECLIDNSYIETSIFNTVVQQFYGYNHAELQKLLKYALHDKNYSRTEMKEQVIKLAAKNQREAEKIITELITEDEMLVRQLLYDLKIITNPEILQRLEALLNNKSKQ